MSEANVTSDISGAWLTLSMTPAQLQALYLLLVHRERPAYGWMEAPLVEVESALKPAHNAIHDRQFNAMNRQFFGDDRFELDEANWPKVPIDDAALKSLFHGAQLKNFEAWSAEARAILATTEN